jgi:hypothetical protein
MFSNNLCFCFWDEQGGYLDIWKEVDALTTESSGKVTF